MPDTRIRVIPNGVNLERFRRDEAAGHAIRRQFGVPEDARLLLFVGHEFQRKGLVYLIGALNDLDPNVWVMVVGSDDPTPYRQLAGEASNRLVFVGAQRNMPAFYSAADAFVLPSAYETFSLVCMEAMACGLPVFAAKVGGIEDYLQDGVNGYGIDFDPADIAAKVSHVLADAPLLERLQAGALATAQRYGWDQIAAQYLSLLHEVKSAKDEESQRG